MLESFSNARNWLRSLTQDGSKRILKFPSVMTSLQNYNWPGTWPTLHEVILKS